RRGRRPLNRRMLSQANVYPDIRSTTETAATGAGGTAPYNPSSSKEVAETPVATDQQSSLSFSRCLLQTRQEATALKRSTAELIRYRVAISSSMPLAGLDRISGDKPCQQASRAREHRSTVISVQLSYRIWPACHVARHAMNSPRVQRP